MFDIRDYLLFSFSKDYPNNFDWITNMFGILAEDVDNDYVIKKDKSVWVKMDDKKILVTDEYNSPILNPKMKVNLKAGDLVNLKEDIETTVGRALMNYILLASIFGDKIPYMNKEMNFKDIEKYIVNSLVDNDKPNKGITVNEYLKYMDTVLYIMNFNKVYSVSITKKSSLPPKGIEEYKKQLIKELEEKYGPNPLQYKEAVAEFDKKLLEYDKKWLADDPALGKLVSGKVINARKKMFLAFSATMGFTEKNKATTIEQSLYEGYPKDPEKLAAMFNESRFGSYSRGAETQKGGVAAKVSLRATNNIKVLDKDCGTKMGINVHLTKNNYKLWLNRYMLINGENVLLTEENLNQYLGKNVVIRSPLFCNEEIHFCKYCVSKDLGEKPNGISLLVSGEAGIILNFSMKAMHRGAAIETVDVDILQELTD